MPASLPEKSAVVVSGTRRVVRRLRVTVKVVACAVVTSREGVIGGRRRPTRRCFAKWTVPL